ncbi:MAG TPA: O-antigen ligase family protein [Thermoanaerobaculia bacterium]|nr:O-antigen ligase family protein [Thermoanaerobaculia bacterium]
MTALAGLVTACVAIVPLAVVPDLLDRFHVIKESVMRAEALIGALLVAFAFNVGRASAREDRRAEARPTFWLLALTAAGVAWTGLTALLSTHRPLSYDSFVSVLTSALLFLVVWYAAPRISLVILDVLVPAVMINAALAAVQEYAIYDPFLHDDPNLAQHFKATGLIGNPNVVGSFMAFAALILTVAAVRVRGVRRWLYAFGALVATASVLVSLTRTALFALAAGLLLLAVGRSRKRAAAVVVAMAVLFGAGVLFRVPLVLRVLEVPRLASEGGLEVATSGRVAPALAAWEMFRDRPLIGVGPGAYRYWYTEYKTRVRRQYGAVLAGTPATMFGEAHNDHLQLLAEAGLPGYLLFAAFLAALWLAVRRPVDGDGEDVRQRIARTLVLPLGGAFLVLALAQFPLHLAVTRHLLVTFAGLAIGWSRSWE